MTQIHRGELSQRERGHLGKQDFWRAGRPSEETGCCQHLGAAGPDATAPGGRRARPTLQLHPAVLLPLCLG